MQEANQMREYDEDDILDMLRSALNIRICKQPQGHIQIAYSYIASAEWWWTIREYQLVITFYQVSTEGAAGTAGTAGTVSTVSTAGAAGTAGTAGTTGAAGAAVRSAR